MEASSVERVVSHGGLCLLNLERTAASEFLTATTDLKEG